MPRKRTPPDPERMNKRRAELAQAAIDAFAEAARTDTWDVVSDLLCDLGHWADRNKVDLLHQLRRAAHHYHDETSGKGKQFEEVTA
jgi:hypothetical protein